jgi:hypothetical protein
MQYTLQFILTSLNHSDVKTIASLGMRNNYVFLDTVGEDENTHQHVPQQFVTEKSN